MKSTYLLVLAAILVVSPAFGQSSLNQTLDENYESYDLQTINTTQLYHKLKDAGKFHSLELSLGSATYEMQLWDSDLFSDDYKLSLASGKEHTGTRPLAMKGHLVNDLGSTVRLTINEGFLYGYIRKGDTVLNVQPANYHDNTVDPDLIVSYFSHDVKENGAEHKCGVSHDHIKKQVLQSRPTQKSVGLCYEVEIALAADWLMVVNFGSVSAVENHITAVMSDVEGNYDDEFADEILFDISDEFVSDCSTCDPWTSSTSANALLDDFADWAPGGMSGHDVATLWSDRDFNGSTIGLAWVGSVCTGNRYNVCENFSTNGNLLRVVQAHELGHNFDATHDSGGGFIMSPSANNSSTWSADSMDDVEDLLPFLGCLEDCSNGSPPSAEFDWDIIEECAVGEVEFFDESDMPFDWFWTFEGGNPSTSTDQNPVVTYDLPGSYDVTLLVTNPWGEDEVIETDIIEIYDEPLADFEYETDELEVSFIDLSTGGDLDYFWEFGDGATSDDMNPEHEYFGPGTYEVTLDVENDCDWSIFTQDVNVYDEPDADFTATYFIGCPMDVFSFIDESYGNITEWDWDFPGGSPASSSIENPSVTYNAPGTYSVTLEVENPEGEDAITRTAFITIVESNPTSSFTSSVSGSVVTFTNTSVGADDYLWDFGDGNTSTVSDPTYTYTTPGTYSVTLTAENLCGSAMITETISIIVAPVAAINTTSATTGCAPLTVAFQDASSGNPTSWSWTFLGGSPGTSTLQNPSVSYAQRGTYDVMLTVTNAFGTDMTTLTSHVSVADIPTLTATHTSNLLVANFNSTTTFADVISWNFGDGSTSADSNPTHTYASPGTYAVTVSASNACGTVTENLSVTVSAFPVANFTSGATSGCANFIVQFTDVSTSNPTAWSWTFPGGSPATSTDMNPVVTYSAKGIYDVILQVSNAVGSDIITLDDYISVDDLPTLSANSSASMLVVNFTSTSTNASSVLWNFGDGNTSSDLNPTHTYTTPGSYNVTVSASNPCGSVSENLTVSTDILPAAGINSDVTSGCSSLTVNYSDNSSANTTAWSWTFPGGNPSSSTMQNPTVTYASPGSYDVTLTASNAQGSDTQSWTEYIDVNTTPSTTYESNVIGNLVSLQNTTPGTMTQWTLSDGSTSDAPTLSHLIAGNGTYALTLETTNACGSDFVTFDVTIDAYPASSFTADGSTSGCAPFTVSYENAATQATSYAWQFPGGTPATSSEANPIVVYNTAGMYDATLQVLNAFGSDESSQQQIVVVNDVPTTDFTSEATGATLAFTSSATNASTYEWDFGDGVTSNEENPLHQYAVAGEYEVTFTSTNNCGSTTLSRIVLVDFSTPSVAASFSASTGCAPLEVQITDESINNPIAWSWEFPGGTPANSTEQNPVVTYDIAGVYSINSTVSNADGSSTFEFVDAIAVGDIPSGDFEIFQDDQTVNLTSNFVGATSYMWNFGDGDSSTEINPSHTYTAPGEYIITVEAENDCGFISSEYRVLITPSSIDEIEAIGSWMIAPNPSQGNLSLVFDTPLAIDLTYEIVDLAGKLIEKGNLQKGKEKKDLMIEHGGVYLINLYHESFRAVKKIVILD